MTMRTTSEQLLKTNSLLSNGKEDSEEFGPGRLTTLVHCQIVGVLLLFKEKKG